MKQYKLTVIIPVYNSEKFLPRAINSILQSTLSDIEIIVIDDASQGNCKEIVNTYEHIKYIKHQENKGLFLARLTGIQNAKGEYIAHLDADDWVESNLYEEAYYDGKKNNSELVFFNSEQCDSNQNRWQESHNIIPIFKEKNGIDILEQTLYSNSFAWTWHVCWNKLIKREIALKACVFFENSRIHLNMCEDLLWSISIFLIINNNKTVSSIENNGFSYFRHDESITIKHNYKSFRKKIHDILYVMDKVEELLISHKLFKQYKHLFQQMKITIFSNYFNNVPFLYRILDFQRFYFIKKMIREHSLIENSKEIIKNAASLICKKVEEKSVSIFGTGDLCLEIQKNLIAKNVTIDTLILTYKDNDELNGIKVISLEEYNKHHITNGVVIVASIGSFFHIKKIILQSNNKIKVIGIFE